MTLGGDTGFLIHVIEGFANADAYWEQVKNGNSDLVLSTLTITVGALRGICRPVATESNSVSKTPGQKSAEADSFAVQPALSRLSSRCRRRIRFGGTRDATKSNSIRRNEGSSGAQDVKFAPCLLTILRRSSASLRGLQILRNAPITVWASRPLIPSFWQHL